MSTSVLLECSRILESSLADYCVDHVCGSWLVHRFGRGAGQGARDIAPNVLRETQPSLEKHADRKENDDFSNQFGGFRFTRFDSRKRAQLKTAHSFLHNVAYSTLRYPGDHDIDPCAFVIQLVASVASRSYWQSILQEERAARLMAWQQQC